MEEARYDRGGTPPKNEYMMKKRKDGTYSILRVDDRGPIGMFHNLDKKAAEKIMKKLEGASDARDRRERGIPAVDGKYKGQRLFASFQEHVDRLDEMSAKDHYKKYLRGGKGKGFVVSNPIDRERYPDREDQGLEGPYKSRKSGKIFYYDKKAGKYYDPDSDIYLDVSDVMEETEQVDEAEVYKRPVKISALGGQKNHAIVDSKGVIVAAGMSEKDAKKQKKFGQTVRELPGAKVGQMVKEDVEQVDEIVRAKDNYPEIDKIKKVLKKKGIGFYTSKGKIMVNPANVVEARSALNKAFGGEFEKKTGMEVKADKKQPLSAAHHVEESVELDESRKRIGIKTIKFAKILGLSKAAKDVFASAINMSQTAGVPGMDAPLATADNLQKFTDGDFVGALVYLRKNSSKLPAGGRKYAKEILDALGDEITEMRGKEKRMMQSAKKKLDDAGITNAYVMGQFFVSPDDVSKAEKILASMPDAKVVPNIKLKKEEVELEEAVDQKQLLTMYKKLKKGDKIDVTFDSSIRKGKEPMTLVVTSPHREVGKAKVGRIIFKDVTNMGGVKYFWYNRDGQVSMAQGDMAVSPREVKMSTDEGFASDAQRRAAFASGYKAKGKKGKKEETELEESTPEYRKMMKDYDKSDDKKVFDILDKHGYRLGEQGDTLVRNMLKKFKGDIKKAAAEIMKKYPGMKKEDVQLDETNMSFAQAKKKSAEIQSKFAVLMRKHRGTKVGEVLDLLAKDGERKVYQDSDIKQISKYLTKYKDDVRRVAHQMLIDYMEGDDYLAKKRIPVKEDVQEGKKMKVKLDPNKSMDKVVKTLEDKMTDAEMDKREKIVKSMKKKKDDFKARYGDQADDVMYATATKMAMKDSYELEDDSTINESFESEFPTSAVEILAANMTPVVRDRWVIKEAPFDDIKKIVADKSMMTVKFPDGKQKVDMMTANVLMTVYNALNDANKKKFVEKINAKMGNFIKLVQFSYNAVNPK